MLGPRKNCKTAKDFFNFSFETRNRGVSGKKITVRKMKAVMPMAMNAVS